MLVVYIHNAKVRFKWKECSEHPQNQDLHCHQRATLSVKDFLGKWPALRIESQLCAEFQRITNVNIRNQFYAVLDQHTPSLVALYRQKAARTGKISEVLRDILKIEHKYNPQTAINSSHNLAVTPYLFKELRTTFTDVDPECVKGCKTYFETLRRKYSLAQPEKAQKRNTMKNTAKNRQRKRRLLETRSSVVQTNTERELWKTATIELVSDEDAIVDGRPVWMVRSPPNRTTELSALCQMCAHLH
ncbi:unnamed protein product [Leuciscus chuanchicus]